MVREYQPCQVMRDTYSHAQTMSAYPPVNGPQFRPDVIQGRTEKKRWLKAINAKHGYDLAYD
jgi:hypothetical protein